MLVQSARSFQAISAWSKSWRSIQMRRSLGGRITGRSPAAIKSRRVHSEIPYSRAAVLMPSRRHRLRSPDFSELSFAPRSLNSNLHSGEPRRGEGVYVPCHGVEADGNPFTLAQDVVSGAGFRRPRRASTRHEGRQCRWLFRLGVNGRPHPAHTGEGVVLTLGNAWDGRSGVIMASRWPSPSGLHGQPPSKQ